MKLKKEYDDRKEDAREAKRIYMRKWRVNNVERNRELGRLSYQRNTENRKAKANAYYHANKEKIAPKNASRYRQDIEKIRQRSRDYYQRTRLERRAKPRQRFKEYKHNAKRRGIPFGIDFDQFVGFWGKPCFYCGIDVELIGLDRVDNEQGYFEDNIVSACKRCNYARHIMTQEDFIMLCHRISSNHSISVANL